MMIEAIRLKRKHIDKINAKMIRNMYSKVSFETSFFYKKDEKIHIMNRLIASSRVLEFKSSTRLEKCRVELKFFWKSVESN